MNEKNKGFFIVLFFFLGAYFFSFFSTDSNKIENDIWMDINYIKCLQNNLPCECQREVGSYFVLQLDTIRSSILLLKYSDLEVEQYDIQKESFNSYNVRTINEVNNITIGKFVIEGNNLFYYNKENKKIKFVSYGKAESINDISYYKQNISLLNKALKERGYPRLEEIVNSDSLWCDCIKWPEKVNLLSIYEKPDSWILEIKNDSLFINTILNTERDPDDTIISEKFKAYKWPEN